MISIRRKFLSQHFNLNDGGIIISVIYRYLHKNKDILSKPLQFETKVPQSPHISEFFDQSNAKVEKVKIDEATIKQLQRWSLVKLEDENAITTLEAAIEFANRILDVDTEGVEPLYTVLESRNLELRSDKVSEGNCREDVLLNAQVKEEYYFVAPPGNVPLAVDNKTKPKREELDF